MACVCGGKRFGRQVFWFCAMQWSHMVLIIGLYENEFSDETFHNFLWCIHNRIRRKMEIGREKSRERQRKGERMNGKNQNIHL